MEINLTKRGKAFAHPVDSENVSIHQDIIKKSKRLGLQNLNDGNYTVVTLITIMCHSINRPTITFNELHKYMGETDLQLMRSLNLLRSLGFINFKENEDVCTS